jgi:hypothetical protein
MKKLTFLIVILNFFSCSHSFSGEKGKGVNGTKAPLSCSINQDEDRSLDGVALSYKAVCKVLAGSESTEDLALVQAVRFIKSVCGENACSNGYNYFRAIQESCIESIERGVAEEQASVREKLRDSLQVVFSRVEYVNDFKAWLMRAYLADFVDQLVKNSKLQGIELSPLTVNELRPSKNIDKPGTARVIPYDAIKKANLSLVENDEELAGLDDYVIDEFTSTAPKIKSASEGKKKWAILNNSIVQRGLTQCVGKIYSARAGEKKIAKSSVSLGINSVESVRGYDGKRKWRGPHFLFGKAVHEFESFNDWFGRDLTPDARNDYLSLYQRKEEKIRSVHELLNGEASNYVIANADSRIRVIPIQKGSFGKTRGFLKGKVMNQKAEKEARENQDDPYYYEGRYGFNLRNLFGRETEDDMKPASDAMLEKFTQGRDQALAKIGEVSVERNRKSLNEARQRALTQKMLRKRVFVESLQFSQHELLGSIYRALNREGAIEVVQRLAPADIHNYVATLKGTPLSHLEALEYLKDRLEGLKQRLPAKPTSSKSPGTSSEFEQEIKMLEALRPILEKQEALLGRSSQVTLDIYGTNFSVAQPAVTNRPQILSQNDRKVMLYKHPDGGFSVHTFIGATGINRVDVDPLLGSLIPGNRVGDMRAGPDRYFGDHEKKLIAAKDKTTRDGLPKLKVGDHIYRENIRGSTVVSFYLPGEFSVLSKFEELAEKTDSNEEDRNTEIKVQMGDPLLIRTEVRAVQIFSKNLSYIADLGVRSLDELMAEMQIRKFAKQLKAESDQKFILNFAETYRKASDDLSLEESHAIHKFKEIMNK